MRKEVLVAVFLGGLVGVAVAFGIWRVNSALSAKKQPSNTIAPLVSPTPSPQSNTFELTIIDPEDSILVNTDTVTLSGKTAPRTTVVVASNSDEAIVMSENDGSWKASLSLEPGANVISATAYSAKDVAVEKQITVVYSTEVKERE